jgi:hypothetical protein
MKKEFRIGLINSFIAFLETNTNKSIRLLTYLCCRLYAHPDADLLKLDIGEDE